LKKLEIVKWVIDNNMNYKAAADNYRINYAVVYKLRENGHNDKISKTWAKHKPEIKKKQINRIKYNKT